MRSTKKSEDTAALAIGCFGIGVFAIVNLIAMVILRAVIIYYFFGWFVTPVTEWELQGFIHALGFGSFWTVLINGVKISDYDEVKKAMDEKSENTNEQVKKLFSNLVSPVLASIGVLLLGYITHILM